MRNQLRGCIKINASGKKLYSFINMIHNGRICCFEQYCRKNIFYANIYRHDLKTVRSFANECGVELKYCEYETVSKKIIRYRKRIGIFFGILIAAAATLYFSNIVVTIDIQGNTSVSDKVILAALEELDIKQGSYIDDINFTYCEKELRLMIDKVSWAGIRHTGNRIVVEVTELVEKPEMLQDRMPCNVMADKSAQITYTSVYDGMLMRIVGDYVMQGDMLISGVVEDSTGHVTKHHAMGKIVGIYEETAVFTGEYKEELYQPTGNISNEKYLKLFNIKIPLFISKNDYNTSNDEVSERKINFLGKSLPIGIIREKITETKLSVHEYTDEELDADIMGKIYLYEKNFLNDVKMISREIKSEKNENSLVYTVTYTLEGDIGAQHEIFIK